jgi:hypothetical protein
MEEPFFVEKGKSTVQKEIGPNGTQYTFATNGTMNGNIDRYEPTFQKMINSISIANPTY